MTTSAPCSVMLPVVSVAARHDNLFRSKVLRYCTATEPEAPVAPLIRTVSPDCIRARSTQRGPARHPGIRESGGGNVAKMGRHGYSAAGLYKGLFRHRSKKGLPA